MALRDVAQRCNPLGIIIQARDVVKLLATGMQEGFARFHVDFFQRLQAVAGKSRANRIHPRDACFAHGNERRFGVGLQPLGAAQAGLEGNLVLGFDRPSLSDSRRAVLTHSQW